MLYPPPLSRLFGIAISYERLKYLPHNRSRLARGYRVFAAIRRSIAAAVGTVGSHPSPKGPDTPCKWGPLRLLAHGDALEFP